MSHLPRALTVDSEEQPDNPQTSAVTVSFAANPWMKQVTSALEKHDTCAVQSWKAKGDCQPLQLTKSGGCAGAAAWETH